MPTRSGPVRPGELIGDSSGKPRATLRFQPITSAGHPAWSWGRCGCSGTWTSRMRASRSRRHADGGPRGPDRRRQDRPASPDVRPDRTPGANPAECVGLSVRDPSSAPISVPRIRIARSLIQVARRSFASEKWGSFVTTRSSLAEGCDFRGNKLHLSRRIASDSFRSQVWVDST